MPRTARVAPGGFVYHVLNRSVGRMHMFRKESDFEAFERVMAEAHLRQPIRILSYCGLVIALASGTAGELDGSRQRGFDREGIRPGAGEHRARTTIRRREMGAGNCKESRVRAHRSSGRPSKESERIGVRDDKLIARIPSSCQIDRQTNRVLVSPSCFPLTNRVPVSPTRGGPAPGRPPGRRYAGKERAFPSH
jgi:hypothetical protein